MKICELEIQSDKITSWIPIDDAEDVIVDNYYLLLTCDDWYKIARYGGEGYYITRRIDSETDIGVYAGSGIIKAVLPIPQYIE